MDDDNNFFKIIDDDGEQNVVDVEANELTHIEEVKPEPEESEEDEETGKPEEEADESEEDIAAIRDKIKMLQDIKDIPSFLNNLILSNYNTSCVTALDLINFIDSNDVEIDLDLYVAPIYAIICDINEDWVQYVVNSVKQNWSTSEDVQDYINDYLDSLGVAVEDREANKQALLTVLPESIYKEDSPVEYKYYKAVQLLCNEKSEDDNFDYTSAILKETKNVIDYAATMSNCVNNGIPAEAAESIATEEVVQSLPKDDPVRKTLVESVGGFCGKVIKLRYSTAESFNDALREGLGDYVDNWDETKNKIDQRKAEIHEEREQRHRQRKQEKEAEKLQKMQMEMQQQQQIQYQQQQPKPQPQTQQYYNQEHQPQPQQYYNQEPQPQPQQYYGQQQRQPRNGRGYKQQQQYQTKRNMFGTYNTRNDFAPHIPMEFLACGINVIIALLCLLIFKGSTGLFCCVGLGIACFGFLRKKFNEENAIPMILIGYIVFLIILLI